MIKVMKNGIVLPFLLFLASVALIIGAFFLLDNKSNTSNQNSTQTASPVYEMESWKTYTNEKLKITFKYPDNFYKGDDFGEMNYYSMRFSTCEFKKINGIEAEPGPTCPVFQLSMSLGKVSDQYDLIEKIGIGESKKIQDETGSINYIRIKNIKNPSGNWISYYTENTGKYTPKNSYNISMRRGNNEYEFSVSANSQTIVDNNKLILEKILSTFKFVE